MNDQLFILYVLDSNFTNGSLIYIRKEFIFLFKVFILMLN